MNVDIRQIFKKEDERVLIECVAITPEINDIRSYALAKGSELPGISHEGHHVRIRLADIYYFEALDEKVFAYTLDSVFEIRLRLYEVENAYHSCHFIRCSKSVVLNLMLLDSISPSLNGRFTAHMKNGEKLIISRQYAPVLKAYISGKEANHA